MMLKLSSIQLESMSYVPLCFVVKNVKLLLFLQLGVGCKKIGREEEGRLLLVMLMTMLCFSLAWKLPMSCFLQCFFVLALERGLFKDVKRYKKAKVHVISKMNKGSRQLAGKLFLQCRHKLVVKPGWRSGYRASLEISNKEG
jgi:hypothetical protein